MIASVQQHAMAICTLCAGTAPKGGVNGDGSFCERAGAMLPSHALCMCPYTGYYAHAYVENMALRLRALADAIGAGRPAAVNEQAAALRTLCTFGENNVTYPPTGLGHLITTNLTWVTPAALTPYAAAVVDVAVPDSAAMRALFLQPGLKVCVVF
jgi:hypothetical protein